MQLSSPRSRSYSQGNRIHWCPHNHILWGPRTCHCWGWSLGYTCNPPHIRPHTRVGRPYPCTFLDRNSRTKSRSCWQDSPRLRGETHENHFNKERKTFSPIFGWVKHAHLAFYVIKSYHFHNLYQIVFQKLLSLGWFLNPDLPFDNNPNNNTYKICLLTPI